MRNGSCVRTLLGHEGPVWCIVRRGNTLASASQDRTVRKILANLHPYPSAGS